MIHVNVLARGGLAGGLVVPIQTKPVASLQE